MSTLRDWQIERFLLGELPAAESEAVARILAMDQDAAGRARQIETSNREILAAHPPRVVAARVRERSSAGQPQAVSWRRSVLVLAASAVLAATGTLLLHEPAPENRIKGLRPGLLLYRHTPLGDEPLADRTQAREGDLVQIAYQAAGRRYGVIVSVDGRGSVTLHHPQGDKASARLVSGQPVRLASAYRLDDAPRLERFFFVTSDRPFDVEAVMDAARRLAGLSSPAERLALPAGFDQSSFTLTKEDKR